MKKPSSSWPKHKKSKDRPKYENEDKLHFGKLASVFIVWGIIAFLTSWYFNNFLEKKTYNFNPAETHSSIPGAPENISAESSNLIGPINVQKRREVYEISLKANLFAQSWSFIEGEVLDEDKKYLFSFAKELGYYTGRDSEGAWIEHNDEYTIKVTFPQRGLYYLSFKTDSNRSPPSVAVTVTKKRGSSLPHFWFGVFALIAGVILNEVKSRTIIKILEEM